MVKLFITKQSKQNNMKNIHTLPTNKPSRLHLIEDTLTITSEYKNSVCDAEVNIYITSDEEIKDVRPHKGKWQLEKGLILNTCTQQLLQHEPASDV